jgi:hypothetical protein
VIKLVWVLRRAEALSLESFSARAVSEYAPLALASQPGARAVALDLVEKPSDRCDAVCCWWLEPEADDPGGAAAGPGAERRFSALSGGLFAGAQGWLVDEVVHWDALPARAWSEPTPGVKMMAFVRRLPGLSSEEFEDRYRRHAEIARVHHPGIARYVQSFVRGSVTDGAPPLDAVAELSFASREDFAERFYRDESSREVVAEDVEGFLDRRRTWSVVTRERLLRR